MTHTLLTLAYVVAAMYVLVRLNNALHGGSCPFCGAGSPSMHSRDCPERKR